MNGLLQSLRNSLGAVILISAGICLSASTSLGQLKPASNSTSKSPSLQAEAGTPKTGQAAMQPPSCTEPLTQGAAQPSRRVNLSWKASTSPDVVGYNVYRRDKKSPTFGKINQKPIASTTCTDYSVQLGHTYYYYVVAADRLGAREGGRSKTATAKIPRK